MPHHPTLTSPGPSRGWYTRGFLPHCDLSGLAQFITYRLADSLPMPVLRSLNQELRSLPPAEQPLQRRLRIEALLDAGYGSCILRHPQAAACVLESWRLFAGVRYDLIAWVVMPNHVHLLLRPYEGYPLAKIVQSWKSYTARRIARWLPEGRAGARRSQARTSSIWMREYWDRYIRNERHFAAAVDYIQENPVRAHLVERPEDWPWSSAYVSRSHDQPR